VVTECRKGDPVSSKSAKSEFFPPDTFDIFIAHCWSYDEEWTLFVQLLDQALGTKWRNWSLPWHDPSINRVSEQGRAHVESLLRGQLRQAKVVFVLAGLFDDSVRRRDWLMLQMDIADSIGVPLIGVSGRDGKGFPFDAAARNLKLVAFDEAAVAWSLSETNEHVAKDGSGTR
jgi:hypothetical protein